MQPWRVTAITGRPLQAMLADVVRRSAEENPAHLSYPPQPLGALPRTRRFANGEDLYTSIGVPA